MRLLITGGCGFLGSNLAFASIARGDEPVVFDNLSRRGSSQNLSWLRSSGNMEFIHGDVRCVDDVREAVRRVRPDAVFHLAGQVAMTSSIAQPANDFQVNAGGTLNILEAVRSFTPEASVLYSSTNKVYGDLETYEYRVTETRYVCPDHPDGFDEQTPLDFRTPYGCSKGAADQYMLDYHRVFGLHTVVFRHSSMYGDRQFATEDQGWIGWFCRKAVEIGRGDRVEPLVISGDGKQVRDLLYVDDLVRLYFAALERMDVAQGQAFNIGGGQRNSLSLLELFRELEGYVGRPIAIRSLPVRKSDQRVFIADIGKVQRILGWTPSVDFREGLDRMLRWVETLDDDAAARS